LPSSESQWIGRGLIPRTTPAINDILIKAKFGTIKKAWAESAQAFWFGGQGRNRTNGTRIFNDHHVV
jgi:hypothetical protein